MSSFKRLTIIVAFVLCTAGFSTMLDADQHPVNGPRKIHVVIIGVPQWNIADYRDNPLGSEIHQTCQEIIKFFSDRFTPQQVQFHPNAQEPCTQELTTYASIRHLLYTELPKFGEGTLTFLFMMSHGEIDRYDSDYLPHDLRFIASDTSESNRQDTSLSVGLELLNWLQKLPKGSTVLAFVDTCNADAVDTMKLHIEGSILSYYGLRFGLAVASLSDRSTYQANFTRSLLDLWRGNSCPNGDLDVLQQMLYDRIKSRTKIKDLEKLDGYPRFLVDYGGPWCLNQLKAIGVGGGRLLFLYQGAAKNVTWHLKQQAPNGYEAEKIVDKSPFQFIIVPPGLYTVTATPQDKSSVSFGKIDLLNVKTQSIFLETPLTTKETYSALNTYFQHAKYQGIAPDEAARLEQVTDFAYARAFGEEAGGVRGGPKLSPSEAGDVIVDAKGNAEALHQIGVTFLRSGDLTSATEAFNLAASSAPSATTKRRNAEVAYLVAAADGKAERAHKLRIRFKLDFGAPESQLVRAESSALKGADTGGGKDALKAASTLKLIAEFPDLVAAGEGTAIFHTNN